MSQLNRHIIHLLLFAALSLAGFSGYVSAQSSANVQPGDEATKDEIAARVTGVIPAEKLRFDPKDQRTIRMIAQIYEAPLQCGADGTVYINNFVPPDFASQQLFGFSEGGSVYQFNMGSITDLYSPGNGPKSWFPGKSLVAFLLWATSDTEERTQAILSPKTSDASTGKEFAGKRYWYIAEFSAQGNYISSAKLDIPSFEPARIAVLDTDEFVILGLDRASGVPRLALLDKSGRLEQYLEPPADFPTKSKLMPASRFSKDDKDEAELFAKSQALGFYQMVRHKDAILMAEPGSEGPLFEVGPGGALRTVNVVPPKGFVIDSVLPSDSGLYVRFRRTGTNDGRNDDAAVYEINESDGSPLEKIQLANLTMWDVICVHKDSFIAIRPGSVAQEAILLSAKPQPADGPN
jgi:hypothetical protein